MTRKFNPLAERATVTPPHNGAVFYQDGGYFNSSGDLVFEDHPATPPVIRIDETTTIDSETGETTVTHTETEVSPLPPADPRTVLTSWLKGETELAHGTVRSLVKKGFGQVLGTRDEIVKYLVNEANLVPAELVKVS
jgi:hypothetical protein